LSKPGSFQIRVRRVPGLKPGALSLFCLLALLALPAHAGRELALDLFAEQNWSACRAECERHLLLSDTGDREVLLVKTIADARLGRANTNSLARLAADPALGAGLRKLAEEELLDARLRRRSRDGDVHWSMQPLRWILLLYQSQIRPALGRRCSLHPGCSTFMMESIRRHGLIGVPMYTDRAVREPTVVQEKKTIVHVNGRRTYSDTVDDHDWWMMRRSEKRRRRDRRKWVLPLSRAATIPKGTGDDP